MPAVYHFEHIVQDDEIDELGHVNNLVYLKWMQSAAIEHSTVQGWSPERYSETGSGWVVRSHFIEYRQAAYTGERIVVQTWVSNFKKITSLRKFIFVRTDDGRVVAVAATNWAFIGTAHYVPRRIPQELIDSFEVVPEKDEPSGDSR